MHECYVMLALVCDNPLNTCQDGAEGNSQRMDGCVRVRRVVNLLSTSKSEALSG